MAYVSAAALLADLPVQDPSVTPEEAQTAIDRWVGLVEEAGGATETAEGRDIVETGAGAEVLRKALRRSGYLDTEGADKDLDRAYKRLDRYDGSVVTDAEQPSDAPAVWSGFMW